MQEVFEKIIEKLNCKKAYFKRFYECEGKSEHDADLNKSTQLAFEDAIEIVKQEAEKFGRDTNVGSNGWIPCSVVDHPDHCRSCEVTMLDIHGYTREIAFFTDRWRRSSDKAEIAAVAWKEPSEPYQPKGE